MAQKDPTGGTDREEGAKKLHGGSGCFCPQPSMQEAEQEDEPSLGREHWSRSAEVCEPASSDLCKQTRRTAGTGQTQVQGWGGPGPSPSRDTLSSGAHGVKDPGDGAEAQHIWGLV